MICKLIEKNYNIIKSINNYINTLLVNILKSNLCCKKKRSFNKGLSLKRLHRKLIVITKTIFFF